MPAKKKTTFEHDLARLSEIVTEVEDSGTPLDTALKLFKEGLELSEKCGKMLKDYEGEILTLQASADGTFSVEPFGALSQESFRGR